MPTGNSAPDQLPVVDALSPALVPWKRGEAPAYEIKFVLQERQACRVEESLAEQLQRDPHALPELGYAYPITTVYCDTPDFDVFHRVGSNRRRKYRLRSYGPELGISLERKTKVGQRVRKKRTIVPAAELSELSGGQPRDDWSGAWFHRQLLNRTLQPVCCISYLRRAYVGAGSDGPIRLTFDRGLTGAVTRHWLPELAADPITLLEGQVVCEFKFRGAMPALFKNAIRELQLVASGNSKYRHCVLAASLLPNGERPHA